MMKQVILGGAVAIGLAAAPVFAADEAFVMKVAKGGMAEVELGKLASEKGKRMVDDHSKANDELKTLATTKKVTLPSDLNPEDKALRDKLTKLSGRAFDQAYMKAMLSDHIKDVNEFKMEAKSGKDADVKAWAAKTLPTLEEHLKMAREAGGAVRTSGKK
jgi:putative membrane protein